MENIEKPGHVFKKRAVTLLLMLATALALGVIFDWLFFKKALGISWPVFAMLFTAVVLAAAVHFKAKLKAEILLLLVPMLFYSLMVAVRANMLLTFLNIFASFLLMFLLLEVLSGKKLLEHKFTDYIVSWVIFPAYLLEKAGNFLAELFGLRSLIKGHRALNQVIKGVLMALPALLVFVLLFSSADLVFKKYLLDIFRLDIKPDSIFQTVIIFSATFYFCGILNFISKGVRLKVNGPMNREEDSVRVAEGGSVDKARLNIGSLQISVFLGLINVLFLGFIMIQLTYLFGGVNNISLEGFTYAEYARRGFFELIWVGIFSFMIVTGCEYAIERKKESHSIPFRVLSSLLIAQVLLIMSAAFVRLSLYEQAYGFTELRLYSHIFIVWLGLIFLVLGYKILVDRRENVFMFSGLMITLVFLVGLNLMNPDAFISRQNIARIGQPDTVDVDVNYLFGLSDDAVPELVNLLAVNDGSIQSYSAASLHRRMLRLADQDMENGLLSWHYGRSLALDLLMSNAGRIRQL